MNIAILFRICPPVPDLLSKVQSHHSPLGYSIFSKTVGQIFEKRSPYNVLISILYPFPTVPNPYSAFLHSAHWATAFFQMVDGGFLENISPVSPSVRPLEFAVLFSTVPVPGLFNDAQHCPLIKCILMLREKDKKCLGCSETQEYGKNVSEIL